MCMPDFEGPYCHLCTQIPHSPWRFSTGDSSGSRCEDCGSPASLVATIVYSVVAVLLLWFGRFGWRELASGCACAYR